MGGPIWWIPAAIWAANAGFSLWMRRRWVPEATLTFMCLWLAVQS